jgi:hypothetical protein
MIARVGAEVPFGTAAALVADLAGITVNARTVERSAEASGAAEAAWLRTRAIRPMPPPEPLTEMLYVETDGTGVPMRPSETAGHDGKGADGTAGTREVKLARFFTASIIALRYQHSSGRWDELWPASTPPARLRAAI